MRYIKTHILKIDPGNPDLSEIGKAANFLRKGKVVVFPTDTVYGIGADAYNRDAVQRIFEIKERDSGKPLQVLIARKSELRHITSLRSDMLDRIVSRFMPGTLTLVLPAMEDFPKWVSSERDYASGLPRRTVGVRMPANPIALKLIECFGAPVAATSANMSGYPDPRNADEVLKYLDGRFDLLIDGGATPDSVPSTVFDISVNPPVILRKGKISEEELKRAIE